MKVRRGILIIVVAVLLLATGLISLSTVNYRKNTKEFPADGFILKPSEQVNVTMEVNEQYYFSQGAKYKEKYGEKVLFKDKTGTDVVLGTEQFLHYADGSLGSFTKGVIMSLSDIKEGQFGYYSLTKNTILVKNGNSYEMSSRGESMSLSEFIWKISDTDYMITSPEVTLRLSESTEITLPNYAQIKYVDNGIVRIVHQQGTYQTVSADTFLSTQNGAELNLVGKSFYINGEPAVSLDSMSIDDDSYIELDENADSPELKIPTFNVINGKDGSAGTDGAEGEEGEDGEEGEVGEEGEAGEEGSEGAEGAAGAQGSNGINGADGLDGLEGDSGVMGYDGANGVDGKDGKRKEDLSGIVGVEVLSRPIVTMDSSSFDITPGGVQMKLNMSDSDNSLLQGSTEIKIYDRATMQEISPPNNGWGISLEQNGSFQINMNTLSPDKDYVLIVSGKYVSEESDLEGKEANLFTKVFKTDALGLTLEKQSVTDASLTLRTIMTSTSIGNYDVLLYQYDNDGNKVELAKYPALSSSNSDLLFNENTPSDSNRIRNFVIESNTTYYAALTNVTTAGSGAVIATDGTEIKVKTLKKKPYKAGSDENNKVLISAMAPTLTANDKFRTLTVTLDALTDKDNGIQGYRYELYKASDVTAAIDSNSLTNLIPAYTLESSTLKVQTFNLPTDDKENYVARVVVIFDDNEKEVEYSTLFSTGAGLSDATFPVVEIIQVNKTPETGGFHETIDGYVRVVDAGNMLTQYISDTYPLVLTISSEYEDVYSIKLVNTVNAPETNPGKAVYYYFKQTGLRAKTAYALSVSGPVDTDNNSSISDAEKFTYLAGIRAETTDTYGLSAVFTTVSDATTAFKKLINFTSSASGSIPTDFYKYETKTMETLKLELVHRTDDGVEKVIGNPYIIKDSDADTHGSIFFSGGWVDRGVVTADGTNGLTTANPKTGENKLLISPASFGLDDNDSVFFGGGTFIIRVVTATDYTNPHQNVIPFTDKENLMEFKIKKKHIQAADPTSQVSSSVILNKDADTEHKDANLREDTPVGLLLQANYPYADALEITYQIYKLKDNEVSPDGSGTGTSKNIYPGGTDPASITDGGTVGLGELVCELTLKNLQGNVGNGKAEPITLYFSDLAEANNDLTWENKTGNPANQVITRGGRYYVAYQVKASKDPVFGYDCDDDGNPDIYPYCTYNAGEPVPYYRSKVVSVVKQTPKVQRYPWTSDKTSMTWKYKMEDPDKAITLDAGGTKAQLKLKSYASIGAAATSTATVEAELANYLTDFTQLQLKTLTNGYYYTVTVPYKLLTSETTEQEIISAPVQFIASVDTAPSNIEARGKVADESVASENRTPDGHEMALINQGGYLYRLTLRGSDIYKYAALRVTFIGKDASNNEKERVVYDPVYLDIQQGTMQDTQGGTQYPYGYAYMDTSPLKAMKENADISAVDVIVQGYYSTFETGMSGYVSTQAIGDSKKELVDETLYALKSYDQTGKPKYIYFSNNIFVDTAKREDGSSQLNKSLFVPGAVQGNGFTESELSQRYAGIPLVLLSGNYLQSKTVSIECDQSGMKEKAAANASYYTAEKLALSGALNFGGNDTSYHVNLGDILPAVKLINSSQGVMSVFLNFEVLGTGATNDSKLYAQIMERQSDGSYKNLKVAVDNEVRDSETIYYYITDESDRYTDAADYYNQGNYKDNTIPVIPKDGKITLPLRVRGLKANTEYRIIMFAYDTAGNRKDLYSLDGETSPYAYEIKTKNQITINTSRPDYIYNSYSDKQASFGFAIPGDEGTGMIAKYSIIDSNGNVVYGPTDLAPLGSGDKSYYSQKIEENNKMTILMNPSASGNILKLGTEYKLKVEVFDKLQNSIVGTKEVIFTTPAKLDIPDFYIQLSQETTGENTAKVTANIVCTDSQFSTVDNMYVVEIYKGNTTTGSPIETKTVTKQSDQKVQTVVFSDLSQESLYTVSVKANADVLNNATSSTYEPVEKKMTITTSGGASATLGATGTAKELTLTLSNLKNFSGVRKILVTAYRDGVKVYNTTDTGYDGSQTTYEMVLNWGSQSDIPAGTYEIQVQYQTGSGEMLGNDVITVKVSGTAAFSLFNSGASQDNKITTDSSLTEENGALSTPEAGDSAETGQTTGQAAGQTTNQTTGQTTNQTTGQTTNQTTGQTTNQTTGQTTSQTTNQTSGQAADQTTGSVNTDAQTGGTGNASDTNSNTAPAE
jgi:hypothetical protein